MLRRQMQFKRGLHAEVLVAALAQAKWGTMILTAAMVLRMIAVLGDFRGMIVPRNEICTR